MFVATFEVKEVLEDPGNVLAMVRDSDDAVLIVSPFTESRVLLSEKQYNKLVLALENLQQLKAYVKELP